MMLFCFIRNSSFYYWYQVKVKNISNKFLGEKQGLCSTGRIDKAQFWERRPPGTGKWWLRPLGYLAPHGTLYVWYFILCFEVIRSTFCFDVPWNWLAFQWHRDTFLLPQVPTFFYFFLCWPPIVVKWSFWSPSMICIFLIHLNNVALQVLYDDYL